MPDQNTVPNLDSMQSDELMEFWMRHQRGRGYKLLFPTGGKGTRIATGDLAAYAANAATARSCRLRGDIRAALIYERICDNIYSDLPDWARGW